MKQFFIILVLFVASFDVFSQSVEKVENLNSSFLNLGLSGKYTEVNNLGAGWIGISGAYVLSEYFEIGLKADGLLYDRKLNALDKQKSYHLQSGHAGLVLDWHPLGRSDFHFSVPLYMGQGEVSYLYDKEYRKELAWKDEIIDKTTFSILQIGLEFEGKIYKNWSFALKADITSTSPIEMFGTDEHIFCGFAGGITIKYNFFK